MLFSDVLCLFVFTLGLENGFNFKTWLQNQFNEVHQLDGKYNVLMEPGKPIIV